jgi:hypothetical protein
LHSGLVGRVVGMTARSLRTTPQPHPENATGDERRILRAGRGERRRRGYRLPRAGAPPRGMARFLNRGCWQISLQKLAIAAELA